jgi:eukaryotic-like serine/threonine-protein kinase
MTPERHQQICDLLYQVMELQPEQRDSFLEQACQTDHDLRREVDVLLSGNDEVRSSFLRLSTVRLLGPGTRVGDFEIESLIGSGGMGEVYRARDLQLPREVAIKVISSYLAADEKQLRRFEQEAHAAAATNHPNILTIFHLGNHEGVPYLVSELLEGETLRDKLRRGRILLPQAIDLAIQIARGLAAAHEKGIVHRDLKPENLFITKHGQVKILDFGLAKLTQSLGPAPNPDGQPQESLLRTEPGIIMGTAGYMSPEQARGQPTDARSDIFSFGAVLYEMIAGKPAFQRATKADSISSVLNQQPPALAKTVRNVPGALQRLIDRCLEKEPARRFQDASELVTALQTLPTTSPFPVAKALTSVCILILLVAAGYHFRNQILDLIHNAFQKKDQPRPPENIVERNLTANPADDPVREAAISRDAKYVAYTDNSKTVNLLLVDSGDVRPLSLESSYRPDDWFPDGLHLLVSKHGQPGFWKFSTWDSSLRKIFDGESLNPPVISPDGSAIAFVSGTRPNEIWSMGAEGEAPHKVLALDPEDTVRDLAWSPDGKRLAYLRLRGTYDHHESVIETCDLNGGNRSVILSEPKLLGREGIMQGLAWLPDGRIVYSISTRLDEYNLWSVLVGADGRPVAGSPKPITQWQDFAAARFQSASDGKQLVVLKQHSDDSVNIGTLSEKSRAFNPMRLTRDNWRNVGAAWTPDSKSILLFSQRNGSYTIRKQSLDGSTAQTLVNGRCCRSYQLAPDEHAARGRAENRAPERPLLVRVCHDIFSVCDVRTAS